MLKTMRGRVWGAVLVLMLVLVGVVGMGFTNGEVSFGEAAAYGVILLLAGGAYEMAVALKRRSRIYRAAFILGLVGALLLIWVNGAVGIIGSEDNPANLLYGAVLGVGLLGTLAARFRPRGMAATLSVAAGVQFLVPVFALFVWPAETHWGAAGVMGVFIFSSIFAVMFAGSAGMFWRARDWQKE